MARRRVPSTARDRGRGAAASAKVAGPPALLSAGGGLTDGAAMRFLAALYGQVLPAITLTARRVYLRPPRIEDWRAFSVLRLESRAFLEPWEPRWPADAGTRAAYMRRFRRQVREWRADRGYSFMVCRRGDDVLMGGLSLSHVRRGVAQSAQLGYWMGAAYADNGYMTEAVDRALDFAFAELGLHRVEAAYVPGNDRSARLLAKAGFREEGYARAYLKIDGAWRDHVLTAVLHDDPRPPRG